MVLLQGLIKDSKMSLYYVISKCFAFVYLKGQIENKSHLKITSYKFIFYKRSETLLKNKKKKTTKQANKRLLHFPMQVKITPTPYLHAQAHTLARECAAVLKASIYGRNFCLELNKSNIRE